jgi:hypothetical protein
VIGAFAMARRRELFAELQPLVVDVAEHPWSWAAELGRAPEGASRWNPKKDLSFVALRPETVVEVRYDYLEGARFRHPRSSCAGARIAIRRPAATRSSASRRRSTSPTPSPGDSARDKAPRGRAVPWPPMLRDEIRKLVGAVAKTAFVVMARPGLEPGHHDFHTSPINRTSRRRQWRSTPTVGGDLRRLRRRGRRPRPRAA